MVLTCGSSSVMGYVVLFTESKMPERITAENLLCNVADTLADSVPKQKPMAFFEEQRSMSSHMNRLFGRQKPLHKLLGGGKSADVLLWRNKKISLGVLAGATAVWLLFEWLKYNFLTLSCFALAIGMIVLFAWSSASVLLNRTPAKVPRLVLPGEPIVNAAVTIASEVNRFLGFLQDIAIRRNIKQFLAVLASLWAAAIIGTWCNFLTFIYIGFVAAHTLPVLYERYEDQVDDFIYSLLGQIQNQYKKIDSGLISRIPKGNLKVKKFE